MSGSTGTALLREAELVEEDGMLLRPGEPRTRYSDRWEAEARDDHVRSATATHAHGPNDFARLTSKVSPLWGRFPSELEVGTVLEIGSGYGRIPLYLARHRGLTFDTYCAVDISRTMLRRLLEYRDRFALAPDARVYALCISADALPLHDDSVDLVISSAVFLHMGKAYVTRGVREIARVLRPGGSIVFDASFPNARNPANMIFRLKPARFRAPNYLKYWTRGEIEQLIATTRLVAKAGPLTVEASDYALLPKRIGSIQVPFARLVNRRLGRVARPRDALATSYSAYSQKLIR